MASLSEAIVSRLGSVAAVTAVVSTRVRPGQPAESDVLPSLYFEVTGNTRGRYLANATGRNSDLARARVQFVGLALRRSDAEAIRQALESAWDGYRGTVAGIRVLSADHDDDSDEILDPAPGTDAKVFAVQCDYRFCYRITPVTFS